MIKSFALLVVFVALAEVPAELSVAYAALPSNGEAVLAPLTPKANTDVPVVGALKLIVIVVVPLEVWIAYHVLTYLEVPWLRAMVLPAVCLHVHVRPLIVEVTDVT